MCLPVFIPPACACDCCPLGTTVCLWPSDAGDRAEAIDWYSKGITELEKAVAMTVHTTGELGREEMRGIFESLSLAGEEEKRKVEEMRKTMLKNIEMSHERVDILCEHLSHLFSTTVTVSPASGRRGSSGVWRREGFISTKTRSDGVPQSSHSTTTNQEKPLPTYW